MPSLPEAQSVDHKRTVAYWMAQCHLAFLQYSPETNGLQSIAAPPLEGTSQIDLPVSTGSAGRLLTAARSYEKLSGQCRMGANILYAAWALRSILESPTEFLVSPAALCNLFSPLNSWFQRDNISWGKNPE